MTEHNMDHMKYLNIVAASDVEVLRRKEATYQGSWKRSGGRSAWFMCQRMIDRLLVMLGRPETPVTFNLQNVDDTIEAVKNIDVFLDDGNCTRDTIRLPGSPQATAEILKYLRDSYVAQNIFAKIRENPSGADGTVLAVMRDLRRYLTLIEAEMIARGVVQAEAAPGLTGGPGVVGPTGPRDTERRVPRPAKPDADESRHASLAPWQVEEVGGDFLLREFYKHAAHKVWRLEPFVVSKNIPRQIAHCYDLCPHAKDTWIIRMENLPLELRGEYPELLTELNEKEYEEHPQKFMYMFSESERKYRLREHHREDGWGRES